MILIIDTALCSSRWNVYSVDVWKSSKRTYQLALAAFFLGASGLGAQISQDTPPPSSAASIFPLAEVHRGLHGVAYTVFEGTQPEAMNVEILGVLKNALGPGQDMILARLKGTKPEYTGVVAGMSGSPVYVDGKLLGALSYRIGQFSKEPIAGITPIAEMLDVGKHTAPLYRARAATASQPAVEQLAGLNPAPPSPGPTETAASPEIRPIETPLVFSGFSQQAVQVFGDRFRALGFTPVAGLGGVAGGSESDAPDGKPGDPLLPGSAVSALLVKGDMEIAATCTVTFVDPSQVLACGHPITQFGKVSMPMTQADVVATLASPLNSFKIINTGRTIGSFTDDRASAIRGVLGETAQMIPVTIHLRDEGQERTLHIQVVDNADVTPTALMVSLYQSLMQNNAYGEELTYSVQGSVTLEGYPRLKLDSFVAPTAQLPSALRAALSVGQRFGEIYGNPARLHNVQGVELTVDVLPGRRSIELETARVTVPSAHAGDTVMVEATLRPFQGQSRNLRIPIRLPQTLPPGALRILLSDGNTLDRLTSEYPGIDPPQDLSGMIHQLNSAHADNELYVTLLLPEPQAVIDGRTLPSIPVSMANVLEPLRANREMSLHGESVVPVTSIPVEAMLTGQQVISLDIE
ncbi:MAG TPA: SpoIVB peptidase S55 domain-containing protein [Acidobacteriaceae bacterium]|nr:SpoIVB peptidase S55 domain-containing protein [Acidobacteriaceae bacterium]